MSHPTGPVHEAVVAFEGWKVGVGHAVRCAPMGEEPGPPSEHLFGGTREERAMGGRPGWLVRAVRRTKKDDAFDIDASLGAGVLVGVTVRRGFMALRGMVLGLRSGHLVFPVFVGRGVVVTNPRYLHLNRGAIIKDCCRLDCLGRTGITLGAGTTLRRGVHLRSRVCSANSGSILGERVGLGLRCGA